MKRKHPAPLVLAALTMASLWIATLLQLGGMQPCVMCIQVRLLLVGMLLVTGLWWQVSAAAGPLVNRLLAALTLGLGAGVAYIGVKLMNADPAKCVMAMPSWIEAKAEALWPWFFSPTGICGDPAIWMGVDLSTWTVMLGVLLALISLWGLWVGKAQVPARFGGTAG